MSGTAGSAARHAAVSDLEHDREIELLCAILEEQGTCEANELSRLVEGGSWGPGRFRAALRDAVGDGRVRRVSRTSYTASPRPT
jgi:hypothetical protein